VPLRSRLPVQLADTQPQETHAQLTRAADLAMYSAKEAGGGRVHFFDPSMPGLETMMPGVPVRA
jgi:predicted signal transduction protein with EAL and GGDEF domain